MGFERTMPASIEVTWARRPLPVVAASLALAIALWLWAFSQPAVGAYGVSAFDGDIVADSAGTPFTQAGGTPYAVRVGIRFNTKENPRVFPSTQWPEEPPKNILVDLPPGMVGNTTGLSLCKAAQLGVTPTSEILGPLCPPGSQVGLIRVHTQAGLVFQPYPVFAMDPPPGVPAQFGANIFSSLIVMSATVRSDGDYGISVNTRNAPEGVPVTGATVTFWGVPADPSHDDERACPGKPDPYSPGGGGVACETEAPRQTFLRLPTSCTAPGVGLATTVRTDSWYTPGVFHTATFESHLPPGLLATPSVTDPLLWGGQQGPESCDKVPFDPTFMAEPAAGARAGAPSAYTFDLTLPQTTNPDEVAQSDLRKAVVTLPEGVRVSPASAGGLGGCTPTQIGLKSLEDATCPDSSKVGTVRIDTPLLEDSLTGSVYLATPNDNPSGTLIALYIVARGSGVQIKLAGRVDTDPVTGQLTATFDDNPQTPFSKLHLEFKDGSRAALVNPPTCGTYTTKAVLTSWSGRTVTSESSFKVDQDADGDPCQPVGFTPDFVAGTEDPVAGAFTSFKLRFARDESDKEVSGLTVRMPPGLTAKRKGVELCPSSRAAAGTCGEGARIGSVTVGAGAGSNPFFIDKGRVYLTEGYKGAPFGLSIVVPAVAGPFDLGSVVVRAAAHVNSRTAQFRIVADPLPEVLEGIRLQVSDVRVFVDRNDFIVNPTNCNEMRVGGTLTSTEGERADVSSRFQVGECAELAFKPNLRLIAGKKGRTGRGASVPFTARLRQMPGQANIKSVAVTLPLTFNARLPVVEDACTLEEFHANDCANARTGTAVATTPLLPGNLRGSAYFVTDPNKPRGSLPNLIVALRGEVDVDLVGTITIPRDGRLATTFDTVPDVPVSSFVLRLFAGKNGAVGTTANLCTRSSRNAKARVVIKAHNGGVKRANQRVKIRGCAAKSKAR